MTRDEFDIEEALTRAAGWIRAADSLVIAAGAGMGVDSGLPDFRGPEGFWRAYPALGKAGIGFSDIANPAAFYQHPERAWGFYGHRLNLYRHTIPHAGYQVLLEWARTMEKGYQVFTSNVDGHFHKAGFDPQYIHECHGSIHHLQCISPCSEHLWSADEFEPEVAVEQCRLRNHIPRCRYCNNIARPNILMFGDGDWIETRTHTQYINQERWLEKIRRPVVIEIGAGTAIPSVRYFSQRMQREYQAKLIRVNPAEYFSLTKSFASIPEGACTVLQQLNKKLINVQ